MNSRSISSNIKSSSIVKNTNTHPYSKPLTDVLKLKMHPNRNRCRYRMLGLGLRNMLRYHDTPYHFTCLTYTFREDGVGAMSTVWRYRKVNPDGLLATENYAPQNG